MLLLEYPQESLARGVQSETGANMDDFNEISDRLRRVNVTAPEFGNAFGMLSLDGDDSAIELTGEIPIASPPPPGLFNLLLEESNGQKIYIHNAVRVSLSFPSKDKKRTAVLFPNMVVDNAAALDENRRCRSISFRLSGLESCFDYNYFEVIDFSNNLTPLLRAALEEARYDFVRDEPFAPRRVHLFNDLGSIAEFEADGRKYSIFAGLRQHFGSRSRLDGHVRLICTITFPNPVDLDTATDACWDWRRYFNQLTMSSLPFTGMAIAATELTLPTGNVYLANERSSVSQLSKRPDSHYIPLNQWKDREQACDAMRRWLNHQSERRFFRAALDRVLARPGHVAIEDAVALCAGIETLPDLSVSEILPRETLDAMTQAAVSAADKEGLQVDPNRIRGLLGSLQNDDLKRRLRRLASIAAPETDSSVVERWIDVIVPLRVFGAHGRTPKNDHDLIAGPAVDGLAALCARFDMQSNGVPSECGNGTRSLFKLQWDEALFGLEAQRQISSVNGS